MRADFPSSQGLPRFKYVEGLRALACLTVVFNHAIAESYPSAYHVSIPENLSLLRLWFAFGHHAVTAFIVISGFCLGLPAASQQFQREIGWGTFMVRRIARILPPYYAALIISLIIAWAFFPSPVGIHYDFSAHPRSIDILSHVLILQNIVGTGEINYSLWSIATELHIYAGFPLLVKVLSKRGGWFLALLGVLISFALSFLLLETRLSRAYVHLAGAFIVGVGASWVVSGDHNHNFTNILRKISKPVAVGVMTLVVAWTIILPRSLYKPFILPHDFLVMIGIGAVLIWCASISGFGRKLLELKPLVWLGERSYSLYLLHVPIQAALLKVAINSLDLTHTERLVFSLTVGFGILLGLTWVFHRFVEIPAMALSRGVAQHRLVRT
jgi:peptidoglycan/LPS O-acetylase OafA/YrhL